MYLQHLSISIPEWLGRKRLFDKEPPWKESGYLSQSESMKLKFGYGKTIADNLRNKQDKAYWRGGQCE